MGGNAKNLFLLFNGLFFSKTWHPLKKYAPLLLRKRERVVSADMKLWRIASTSGVRTHRKNERFCLAADTLIFSFGKVPNPWFLNWKFFLNFAGNLLILFANRTIIYNDLFVTTIRLTSWEDRPGGLQPWSIFLSRRPPRGGVSHHGAYRYCATRNAYRVRWKSATDGQSPMMSQSPQTRESKAESTLRSPLKIKNEPQTIATLTRNNGVHSTPRVRMGALKPWFTTRPKWSIRQTMTRLDAIQQI